MRRLYKYFAEIYDEFQDMDYKKYTDYICEIFDRYNIKPSLVLDLGCGTGNVTIPLARRGYDMIGVDLSCEMLDIAREKAWREGLDILFLNQDMTEFELYGTVDAIVSSLDSINYIIDDDGIKSLFKNLENYLNPGGIVVFDINTMYKLKTVLGDNTFTDENENVFYIWRNFYDKAERICCFELDFFEKRDDGAYNRFSEYHEEKVYTCEDIKWLSEYAGLEFISEFAEFTFDKTNEFTERAFYVLRKPKKSN